MRSHTIQRWRSLFLPLSPEEFVVFACFFSSASHRSRQSPCKEPIVPGAEDCRRCVVTPIDVLLDNSTSANTVLCVLKSQRIIGLDLSSEQGPTRLFQFDPGDGPRKPRCADEAGDGVVATCASLIPLDVAFACCVADSLRREEVSPHADEAVDSTHTLFRGVIGSSNGRIDVFTESSFAFGFAAHDCPVAYVSALYFDGGVQREESSDLSVSLASVPQSSVVSRTRGVSATMQRLGFLSMGLNGVAFVWKRDGASYARSKFVEPGLFSKCHAITTCQPTRSLFVSCTSAFVEPHCTLIFTGGNGFERSVRLSSCSAVDPVEPDVQLEGLFSRTTAIAASDHMCIVARERVIFRVDYRQRCCDRLMTTHSAVHQLELQLPIGACGCKSGKIYIFSVQSGSVFGTFYTYSRLPVISIRIHLLSATLLVVDEAGAAEVVDLPMEVLRCGAAAAIPSFASQEVLRARQVVEERRGASAGAVGAAQEHLILSYCQVPEVITRYLSPQYHLL